MGIEQGQHRAQRKLAEPLWTPRSSVKPGTELCVPLVFMFFPVPWEVRSDPLQRSQALVICQGGQQGSFRSPGLQQLKREPHSAPLASSKARQPDDPLHLVHAGLGIRTPDRHQPLVLRSPALPHPPEWVQTDTFPSLLDSWK